MTPRFRARRAKRTRGGNTFEFALTALMLVLVSLGVVEMSRMALVYTTIANATRAGVRYACSHGSDRSGGSGINGESGPGSNPTEVLAVVENVATAGLIQLAASNIAVSYSPSNTPGSTVTVTVQYTYAPLIGYFNRSLNVPLGSTSQGVITF